MTLSSENNVFSKRYACPLSCAAFLKRNTNRIFKNMRNGEEIKLSIKPKIMLLCLHFLFILCIFSFLSIFSAAYPTTLPMDAKETLPTEEIKSQILQRKTAEEEITPEKGSAEKAESQEQYKTEEKKAEYEAGIDETIFLREFFPAEEETIEEKKTISSSNFFFAPGANIKQLISGSSFFKLSSLFTLDSFLYDSSSRNKNNEQESEEYDYIVVGGGASGSTISRVLADGKMKVLLIERGKARTPENSPFAIDAYGAGLGIADPSISQPIQTPQGVRTHIGIGMGGGSAINIAIMVDPPEDYFEFLQQNFPDMHFDREELRKAYAWVGNKTASPAPLPDTLTKAYAQALEEIGYKVYNTQNTESAENNNTYNNSSAYDKNSTQIPDVSASTHSGYIWRAYSLFNATDNFTRNAADVLVGGGKSHTKQPDTLTIKTQTTVQKVEFDTTSSVPKAKCVLYRNTTAEDTSPLLSKNTSFFGVPYVFGDFLNFLCNPISTLKSLWNDYYTSKISQDGRACIKADGQIILSAGAVLTPALLFKSGVGPLDQIRELGVPLIKEVPKLGSDFSDRVLIPIGVFVKEDLPPNGFTPNAAQIIGIKNTGPDCENYQTGDKTLKCSPTLVESLSGARINEGVVVASRYVLPPEFRDDPIVEAAFNTFEDCAKKTSNDPNEHYTGVCALAEPIVRCIRRSTAVFYFTAEPKSKGYVKMRSDGQIAVSPNYMHATQDLFDAVRGVSNIIDMVNGDAYKGIIEPLSHDACPFKIMNGLIDMILHFGTQITPYMLHQQENFKQLLKHMNYLTNAGSQRKVLLNDEVVIANEETLSKLNVAKDVQDIVLNKYYDDDDNSTSRNNVEEQNTFSYADLFNLTHFNSIDSNNSDNTTCDRKDIYNYMFGCDDIVERDNDIGKEDYRNTSFDEDGLLYNKFKELMREVPRNSNNTVNRHCTPSTKQWAATFPLGVPDSSDPIEIAKYVLSYMGSVWHHSGTAGIGSVVNGKLEIEGIENLSIVDASIIPYKPPMNPTSTVMSLAAYSGIQKLKARNVNVTGLLDV